MSPAKIMSSGNITRRSLTAAALGVLAAPVMLRAQAAYPSQLIRIIVPYAAGGTTDIFARLLGERMAAELGQQVIVENIPGAGGNTGTARVAKSAADGYTLLMGTVATHGISPNLYVKIPYDPLGDLDPVAFAVAIPNVTMVSPKTMKATSVKELITEIKASPRGMSYASSGVGTSIHLSGELFLQAAGVKMAHVPYRGSSPALNDLVAGHVDMMIDNLPSAIELVRGGQLRALAVTTAARSAALPDIPTMQEAGLPGFEASSWFALFAPSKTPAPVIEKLNAVILKIQRDPAMKARYDTLGGTMIPMSPADLASHVRAEIAKWGKVIKDAGIKQVE